MPNPEFDFQRPDNPNRIYSTHRVIASLAFLVNNIAAKTIYTDISATIVMPEPGIGDDPKYGLDIESSNTDSDEYIITVQKLVERLRPRFERFEASLSRGMTKISEKELVQRFEQYRSRATLRARSILKKTNERRFKKK